MRMAHQGFGLAVIAALLTGCSTAPASSTPNPEPVADAPELDLADSVTPDPTAPDSSPDDDAPVVESDLADTNTADDAGDPIICQADWCDDNSPIASTSEALEAFWSAHGGQESFPQLHVTAIEAMLHAEDAVARGMHREASERVSAVFDAYPLSNDVWWTADEAHELNLGSPPAYYGLRMLQQIADSPTTVATERLLLTVVLADCGRGTQPADRSLSSNVDVEVTLDEAVAAQDYLAIREAAQLFRLYVRALTRGELAVDLAVQHVDECVELTWSAEPNHAGVSAAGDAVAQVPRELAARTDMWWVIYPSNVPTAAEFEGMEFITGGMGGVGRAPLFIVDDQWLLRSPPHLGSGSYSSVERRVYLPQWMMHEFYHHLFRSWPEFGLEATSHQWFDRSSWPDDFEGKWEPDYFVEAFNRRLATASPTVADALRTAPANSAAGELPVDAFVGRYERSPYENGYHGVTVSDAAEGLRWTNDAGVSWLLSWSGGLLVSEPDGPYGEQLLGIETVDGPDGASVATLWFNGEPYVRQ